MWQDRDRFPLSSTQVAEITADEFVRPFGLRFVDYSPGRPRFSRPRVTLCQERQIGLVDGLVATEVMPVAASMTQTESDGKDVLAVDWSVDDK
jgi:putative ATP-grasp target RiPP